MSEEQEAIDRNFRSAYYKSLGVRGSEKSVTHLEQLLKAEVFDVKKLKSFCLKHALTIYYRPLVWKIILSVVPVFADKDTQSFIEEQKKIEFYDLKHALQVMGRLERAVLEGVAVGAEALSSTTKLSSSSTSCQSSSPDTTTKHTPSSSSSSFSQQPLPPSSSSSTHAPLPHNHLASIPVPIKSPANISPSNASNTSSSIPKIGSGLAATELQSAGGQVVQEHRLLSQQSPSTPRDFVTIFLLENNSLPLTSVNQMKQEKQLNMLAIAEAFFVLFDDEPEDCRYWLFSNFQKKLESYLVTIEEMHDSFHQLLEDIDCTLLEHINDLDAHDDIVRVTIERWFLQCYAKELPESCIESIWDRVIGGSCVILVYLAIAILLSFKRKILGFSNASQLQQLLNEIPKENFGLVVSKAIEIWESHGCPLMPSGCSSPKTDPELSQHELYEIEDYT